MHVQIDLEKTMFLEYYIITKNEDVAFPVERCYFSRMGWSKIIFFLSDNIKFRKIQMPITCEMDEIQENIFFADDEHPNDVRVFKTEEI